MLVAFRRGGCRGFGGMGWGFKKEGEGGRGRDLWMNGESRGCYC